MGSIVEPSSRFSDLKPIPYDEAYFFNAQFVDDLRPDKVNLGPGVYRDDDGKPWLLPSVNKALALLDVDNDYLSQQGFQPFLEAARSLLFGNTLENIDQELTTVQTVSGTGACHVGAVFLANTAKPKKVWISDPSWINHEIIWERAAPRVERKLYPYYHAETKSFDLSGMIGCLERESEPGDVIILQACAHNPTGLDPSEEQWKAIADVCEKKKLIPFFDSAYQGFASGDAEKDAWAVRYFAQRASLEICYAQSFSKNFGLYGQRVGAVHMLARDRAAKPAILSHLIRIVRSEISSSPSYGCRIVAKVLGDPALRKQWQEDNVTMSSRIRSMREALYSELQRLGTPGTWEHVISQIGMFSYTGLNESQAEEMREKYGIHLYTTGRVSISGLNTKNVSRVAQGIDSVTKSQR